jgi:hypothetical protein
MMAKERGQTDIGHFWYKKTNYYTVMDDHKAEKEILELKRK